MAETEQWSCRRLGGVAFTNGARSRMKHASVVNISDRALTVPRPNTTKDTIDA
ncbi:hypothetical protein GFS60_00242 [Rhodococcus sp. WAY2]|nr:hypothetical protein GFS60_00242 [Rhodococcus sp. WAY2]